MQKSRRTRGVTVAARDRHLPARPAARVDDRRCTRPCRSPSRIGLDLIAIEKGAPLELDLRHRVGVRGRAGHRTVSAPTAGECARCLTPITGDVEIDLTELFAYPDSATEATTDADEVGHVVDRRPSTSSSRSSTRSGWRCRSRRCARRTAPGLCPQCGVALADAEPGHQHEQIDPRWAKLAEHAAGREDRRRQ